MFPIDTHSLQLLAMVGFALLTSISFAFGLRWRIWVGSFPVIVAMAIFGYLWSITEWEKEYAWFLPFFVGGVSGAILITAFLWVGIVHLVFQRMATGHLARFLIVAALPSLIAAPYVVWDQTLPQNECTNSHLDVSVMGSAQYRVYPEFKVRFDRLKKGGTGLEFQALYSSLRKDKRALAQLCRQEGRIETARFWITPTLRADAVEAACQARERAFCSKLDPTVMRQLSSVRIGRNDRSEIEYFLGWFSRKGDNSLLAVGDSQDGALCQSVGTRSQHCTVWRSFGSNQLGIAQTIANGSEPEEMIEVANEGLDQMLRAFSPPQR